MIYQGAEAKIIRSTYHNIPVVRKERLVKRYRIKQLNDQLISARTKEEAKLMGLARRNGVPVPVIYDIDIVNGILTMAYLDGPRVKDIFDLVSEQERKHVCFLIGETIARLHSNNIIHGDLTTSNMIVLYEKIYLIDFGLGEINPEIESKGVDLHVLMEAMESTHAQHATNFQYVLEGYKKTYPLHADEVIQKIDDIVMRGRYR
jgi:Kae1-associated kinase Bud32